MSPFFEENFPPCSKDYWLLATLALFEIVTPSQWFFVLNFSQLWLLGTFSFILRVIEIGTFKPKEDKTKKKIGKCKSVNKKTDCITICADRQTL